MTRTTAAIAMVLSFGCFAAGNSAEAQQCPNSGGNPALQASGPSAQALPGSRGGSSGASASFGGIQAFTLARQMMQARLFQLQLQQGPQSGISQPQPQPLTAQSTPSQRVRRPRKSAKAKPQATSTEDAGLSKRERLIARLREREAARRQARQERQLSRR